MALGIGSAVDDDLSADGASAAAGTAPPWHPRGSMVRAPQRAAHGGTGAALDVQRAEARAARGARGNHGRDRFGFDTIIGHSPKFVAAIDAAQKVAATAATVLLTGESGTGKEVLARAIHRPARAPTAPSSRSTARRCRRRSQSPSSSVTSAAPSPARTARSPGASSSRPAGRSSSTRSAS